MDAIIKNPEELLETFKKMNVRLAEAKQDLLKMKEFEVLFDKALKNIEVLEAFYHSKNWINGTEILSEKFPDQHLETNGEDAIWDITQEFYFFKLKMMKTFAYEIYKTIPDFYRDET